MNHKFSRPEASSLTQTIIGFYRTLLFYQTFYSTLTEKTPGDHMLCTTIAIHSANFPASSEEKPGSVFLGSSCFYNNTHRDTHTHTSGALTPLAAWLSKSAIGLSVDLSLPFLEANQTACRHSGSSCCLETGKQPCLASAQHKEHQHLLETCRAQQYNASKHQSYLCFGH